MRVDAAAIVARGHEIIIATVTDHPGAFDQAPIGTCTVRPARRTSLFFSQSEGDAARATKLGIARGHDLTVIGNGVDIGAGAKLLGNITIGDNCRVGAG